MWPEKQQPQTLEPSSGLLWPVRLPFPVVAEMSELVRAGGEWRGGGER